MLLYQAEVWKKFSLVRCGIQYYVGFFLFFLISLSFLRDQFYRHSM